MINILNKEDCVGCNACVNRCPKKCISMVADEQGFLYPKVDVDICIECGLCERVCPVINQAEQHEPIAVYSARNNDPEIVRTSSSGGVFYALAKHIIDEGGVVFGARFDDDWQVIHDWTETIEGLKAFQGSKYVQSRIGDCYLKAEGLLKEGRKVLFSGTPCQLAGLRLFLRKDYGDLLLSVDVVCHGVPSPLVWKDYLQFISQNDGYSIQDIKHLTFRDKRNGWENYGMSVEYSSNFNNKEWFCNSRNNIYMQGFIKDLYLRLSCFYCPAKCGKSLSDITVGDFWGIRGVQPDSYDFNGVSLVMANTQKGNEILQNIDISLTPSTYEVALASNPSISHSVPMNKWVSIFWQEYFIQRIPVIPIITKKIRPSITIRFLIKFARLLRKVIGINGVYMIKSIMKIF